MRGFLEEITEDPGLDLHFSLLYFRFVVSVLDVDEFTMNSR